MNILKYILLFLFFGITTLVKAQKDSTHFVTTWRTYNPGFSNDSSIIINAILVNNYQYIFNYDVDWDDDGVFDTLGVTSGTITHQYPDTGTYTVRIRGQYPVIKFGTVGFTISSMTDKSKLISIDQWGEQIWENINNAFNGCDSMTYNTIDQPILDSIRSTEFMFKSAIKFNGDLSLWDMSFVNYTRSMFSGASIFNMPLNNWDVSSVVAMDGMFASASAFNQPLDNWDVSKVENMSAMFAGAISFDRSLASWDIDSLRLANIMFNLTNWSVANYDDLLISWQAKPHKSNVFFGAQGLDYCLGDSARNLLIAEGWTFSGDMLNCTLVGIDELEKKKQTFKIYPNPSSGVFTLSLDQWSRNTINYQLMDTKGTVVEESILTEQTTEFDISELPQGIYFLRIGSEVKKLVVNK